MDQPTATAELSADIVTLALTIETLGLVDSPPDDAFDKFTRLISLAIDVSVALVSFVDAQCDRQYFKSQIGLQGHSPEDRQPPLTHSFCQFVKRDNRPLIIESAPDDARVRGNLAILELGVQAYLGVPIHGPMGEPPGARFAIDTEPRCGTQKDIKLMPDLAVCATDQICMLRHCIGHIKCDPCRKRAIFQMGATLN